MVLAQSCNFDPGQHDPYHSCRQRAPVVHRARLLRRFQQHRQPQYRGPLRFILHRMRPSPLAASQGHQPVQLACRNGRTGDITMGSMESSRRAGRGQQHLCLHLSVRDVVLLLLAGFR